MCSFQTALKYRIVDAYNKFLPPGVELAYAVEVVDASVVIVGDVAANKKNIIKSNQIVFTA